MHSAKELKICAKVYRRLELGDPVTDKELVIAYKNLKEAVDLLEALRDKKLWLFIDHLRREVQIMGDYVQARKIKE